METQKTKTNPQILKDLQLFFKDLDLNVSKEEQEDLADRIEEENDFFVELDGREYRFIDDNAIWEIYVDELKETTQDCYLGGNELPWWIQINWQETAENVHDADGYGHMFAHYDHEEHEYEFGEYTFNIFRTH